MQNAAFQIESAPRFSNLGFFGPYASALRSMTIRNAEALIAAHTDAWRAARYEFSCTVFLDCTDDAEIAFAEHTELARLMLEAGHSYPMPIVLASFVLEYGEQD